MNNPADHGSSGDFRDLIFDDDAEVVASLRALSDQRLQSYIVAAYDLERRATGEFRDR